MTEEPLKGVIFFDPKVQCYVALVLDTALMAQGRTLRVTLGALERASNRVGLTRYCLALDDPWRVKWAEAPKWRMIRMVGKLFDVRRVQA